MLQSSAPGSALARGPRTGSTAKAVTPSGLLLVEFVEHEVAQEGRERTALWGPLVHRADQAIFHHPGLEKRPDELEHTFIGHPRGDARHLGARIGLTAVLHTWGSALTHHPHAHIIVPGGGFSPDSQRA